MVTPEHTAPGQPMQDASSDTDAAEHFRALVAQTGSVGAQHHARLTEVSRLHLQRLLGAATALWGDLARMGGAMPPDPQQFQRQFSDYLQDALQRAVLTGDTLREAATAAQAHEDTGLKPVLAFDYDVVVEGTSLPRPVNYALVRIRPPDGFAPTRAEMRPWVIIDPRSGQGSGIGGFKAESEVGIALAEGYPVYFVIFSQYPEPGQTLADITVAEAAFLRHVRAAHPATGKPFVTGNCQGGWATMILAATHPDLIGPIVIAGVPLSPWAGRAGQNPLRYLGGMTGGALPAQMLADLGGGLFDGAALVANFETMNPGRDLWRKYADLFGQIDSRAAGYIDFDRWWSGFYFMNAGEIRWIIENIFVGNRLARGQAMMDDGQRIDLSRITSPLVVFASHGDAVSTVQMALRWIPDVWGSAARIREAGRTIIYTTHDSATHLSIFVSADVADDNHRRIGSVIRTIEALPPGLYEMAVQEGAVGTAPEVHFEARDMGAILALCDPPEADGAFANADAMVDWVTRGYDLFAGPWIRAMTSGPAAQLGRDLHPLRLQNRMLSDANPVMASLKAPAAAARAARTPVDGTNPFFALERLTTDIVARQLDLMRDMREAATEIGFLAIYANPLWRPRPDLPGPARTPEVPSADARASIIALVEHGGYAEAIVRMCIILSRVGGQVRQDRIERFSAMLHTRAPFSSMTADSRRNMIDVQSQIVEQAGLAAEAALMPMLRDDIDRYRAVNIVHDLMEFDADSPADLVARFEALQLALRTRARDWRSPARPPQP